MKKFLAVILVLSLLGVIGYKFWPNIRDKVNAMRSHSSSPAAAHATAPAKTADAKPAAAAKTSNLAPPPVKLTEHDLGEVSLTNDCDTAVQLGSGKECIISPKLMGHDVQLTLTLESKTAAGKVHDLLMTQVVTRSGKPVQFALGDMSFSLTPSIKSE